MRNLCLISIVLAKSFNLIPMSKKVRNFFSLYRFFLQHLYGFSRKSSENTALNSFKEQDLRNHLRLIMSYLIATLTSIYSIYSGNRLILFSGSDFLPINRWSIKSVFKKSIFFLFFEIRFSIFNQFMIKKSIFDFFFK